MVAKRMRAVSIIVVKSGACRRGKVFGITVTCCTEAAHVWTAVGFATTCCAMHCYAMLCNAVSCCATLCRAVHLSDMLCGCMHTGTRARTPKGTC